MRDYAKVTATFWTGKTGKALKAKGPEALIVAMYLMTSPHSNMLGLYYLPLVYLQHETGLDSEGASKGLQVAIEAGFCSYDEDSEMVWVHEMAFFQISGELKESDNRCVGIQKEYASLPECPFLASFFEKYSEPFCMTLGRGFEAPPKPRTRTGAGTRAGKGAGAGAPDKPTRLPACPHDAIVDLYHEILPELPSVTVVTEARTKAVTTLWRFALTTEKSDGTPRATNADEALEWIRGYFNRTRENDFLMGRTERSKEHKNWRCSLDYLVTERGLIQVIEKTGEA